MRYIIEHEEGGCPDLTLTTFGRATLDELNTMQDELEADPAWPLATLLLIDHRALQLESMPSADLHRFAARLKSLAPRPWPTQAAIVVSKAVDYGVARMVTGQAGDDVIILEVFIGVDEARTWLASHDVVAGQIADSRDPQKGRVQVAPVRGIDAVEFGVRLRVMYDRWGGSTDGEQGLHRLIQQSSLDRNRRRHSSIAGVSVDGVTSDRIVRTYVTFPYDFVKDHLTGRRTDQVDRVFAGDLSLVRALP